MIGVVEVLRLGMYVLSSLLVCDQDVEGTLNVLEIKYCHLFP